MELVRMRLSELDPAPYNPRRELTEREFADLKRSLDESGYLEPIVVNVADGKNTVVSGHQRLKVMRAAGVESADVSVVELDEEMEKKLNVTLNRVRGEWDPMKLANLLASLEDKGGLGFSNGQLEALMAGAESRLDSLFSDMEEFVDGEPECTCPECGKQGPESVFAAWF